MISKLAELVWNETEGIIDYSTFGSAPTGLDYLAKLLSAAPDLAERYNRGNEIRYTREWPRPAHRQMETELFILGLVMPDPAQCTAHVYMDNLAQIYRESKSFNDRQEMETALTSLHRAFEERTGFMFFKPTPTGRELALDAIISVERMKRAETEEKLKKLG